MIHTIETIEDVKEFFRQLLSEGLNLHPDTPFDDYIDSETRQPTYTTEEIETREKLMAECFEVCEKLSVDIYEIANDIFAI